MENDLHASPQADSTLLLITNYPNAGHQAGGGRELLAGLNHVALQDIYGDRFRVCHLRREAPSSFRQRFDSLRGYIDGVSANSLRRILERIDQENVRKVFIDGSNLGVCARVIKRCYPEVEVTTFFHNVEARFFAGALKSTRSPKAAGVLLANFVAEGHAVRYSDRRICLSNRDSALLGRMYGRTATSISPMAVRDNRNSNQWSVHSPPRRGFALFVGGTFYANVQGVRWFVERVMPRTEVKLCVVGRGFERYRQDLERPGQVDVIGSVERLSDWYEACEFVVAPIFDGSGMKTKVAEALMFGKRIIGTPEAYSGYEEFAGCAGWVCRTPDEFAAAIETALKARLPAFDPELRSLYESHFSLDAARQRLAAALGPLPKDQACAV